MANTVDTVTKELQKLKALVNQKQTTAIFSNKSNESTKLALGDAELYINDMTRKFSFTRAGVKNPVMVDAKTKSIENVEYINGTKVDDMTGSAQAINKLSNRVDDHDIKINEHSIKINEHDDKIQEHDAKIMAHDDKIQEYDAKIMAHDNKIQEHDARLTELEHDSAESVVNELTEVYYDGTLIDSIECSYERESSGVITITFDPKITEESLIESSSQRTLLNISLLNGSSSYSVSLGYRKTVSGNTYTVTWSESGVSLVDGVLIWPCTYFVGALLTDVAIKKDCIQKLCYNLRDGRFKDAVATTALEAQEQLVKYRDTSDTYSYSSYYNGFSSAGSFINGRYNYTLKPPITEDNLKFGSNIVLAEVYLTRNSSGLAINEQLKYSKVLNADNSYTITWHSGSASFLVLETIFTVCSGYSSGYTVQSATHYFSTYIVVYRIGEYLQECAFKNAIINTIYPVGSIYTSLSRINPATLFGVGKWRQIKDRFLYCCSNEGGKTGGSKKITVDNLPAHNHGIFSGYDDYNYNHGNINNAAGMSIPWDSRADGTYDHSRTTYTNNTGSGSDYMPPYINVYAWQRVA